MNWKIEGQMINLEFYSPEKFLITVQKFYQKFKFLKQPRWLAGAVYLQIIVHIESHLVILLNQTIYRKFTIEEFKPVFLNSIWFHRGSSWKWRYQNLTFPWEKYIKVDPTSATLNPRISMARKKC